ncbi:glycosyltransferase [Candidatus Dependentiae bacterium]|nr:glycosyltransferase [Candidatus Dependentiae bacterium]
MKQIKKVLVVGSFNSNPEIYTYAISFYKSFKKLGYEVERFNYRKKFVSIKKLNDFVCNTFLERKVAQFYPDLIFFIKSENIFASTIRRIKNNFNAVLVNFYPDNPFILWNGNSTSNILLSLPIYDCFLTWSKMLIPVLESAGCKKVYYFPFAYDQDLYNNSQKNGLDNYLYDVCFIGTWSKDREIWLKMLCEKLPNLNLGIFGNMWHKKLSSDSILINKLKGEAIYPPKVVEIFKKSKIVLNFIRQQNMTSHNMRTLEVPASGAFLLTQRTVEQANFLFEEGENIECFADVNELVNKIEFYLKNDFLRNQITAKSYKSVKQFTLQNILENWIQIFFELNVKKGRKNEFKFL